MDGMMDLVQIIATKPLVGHPTKVVGNPTQNGLNSGTGHGLWVTL